MIFRVLIAGGGIGGITTALELKQRGIDAHLFVQAEAFREVGAGIQLSANATRVLRTPPSAGSTLLGRPDRRLTPAINCRSGRRQLSAHATQSSRVRPARLRSPPAISHVHLFGSGVVAVAYHVRNQCLAAASNVWI